MTAFCPACGFDLAAHGMTVDGPFAYHPRQGFHVAGIRLGVTAQVHLLLGSIMLAAGDAVRSAILAERIGYEGDRVQNHVAVRLTQARSAVVQAGQRFPVQTLHGFGYRWNRDAVPSAGVRHVLQLEQAA